MPVSANKQFTFRGVKGVELTHDEMDFNFTYLLLDNLISSSNYKDYFPTRGVIDFMYNNFQQLDDVILHDNFSSNEFKVYKMDSTIYNKVDINFINDLTDICFIIVFDNDNIPFLITSNIVVENNISFDFASNGSAYLFVFANNGSNVDLVCSYSPVES